MRTYSPFPPLVSTWIGTRVRVAAGAGARGDGDDPAWGCPPQPASASPSPSTGSAAARAGRLLERIGPDDRERERHPLEPERKEQDDRVDPAVDQERDERRGQAQRQHA